MSTTCAAGSLATAKSVASLYYLQLPPNQRPTYDDLSSKQWKLVVDGPPKGNIDAKKDTDAFSLDTGDWIVFPELLTGAGEFEGLRVVVPILSQDDDNQQCNNNHQEFWLLPMGIEAVEWPQVLLNWIEESVSALSLRGYYEQPLQDVYQKQKVSMTDAIGCELDEFWNHPSVPRRRRVVDDQEPFVTLLSQCSFSS